MWVRSRRKKRKAQKQAQEQTPIGVRTVTLQKQRGMPAGVALMGALLLVSAILLTVQGPLELSSPGLFLDIPAEQLAAFGIIDTVDGITSFIVAFGMLKAKRWAWKWGVVEMYATIGLAVMHAVLGPTDPAGYIALAVVTPIMAAMIYYFYKPRVRAYFGKIPA